VDRDGIFEAVNASFPKFTRCLFGLAWGLFVAGCGGEQHPPVFPVRGVLVFDGKPAPQAVVVFTPLGAKPDEPTISPRGVVREDGSFEMSTYKAGDGAPVGRYKVSVFWFESWRKRSGHGDELGKALLPPHYSSPETSGLPVIEVKAAPNEIGTLKLHR
jgi:hypothetical protein